MQLVLKKQRKQFSQPMGVEDRVLSLPPSELQALSEDKENSLELGLSHYRKRLQVLTFRHSVGGIFHLSRWKHVTLKVCLCAQIYKSEFLGINFFFLSKHAAALLGNIMFERKFRTLHSIPFLKAHLFQPDAQFSKVLWNLNIIYISSITIFHFVNWELSISNKKILISCSLIPIHFGTEGEKRFFPSILIH